MGWMDLSLVAYERIHESITGFKVVTFQHESFEFCINKLSKLI